jgi:hypothetical protein
MENYFIKIEDGPDTRRKLLESSKASLHVLKTYQQLLQIRGEKLHLINSLRKELKEITVLLNQAEQLMPVVSEKELAQMLPKKVPEQEKVIVQKQKMPKIKGKEDVFIAIPKNKPVELQRLEDQLADIESKLGNL